MAQAIVQAFLFKDQDIDALEMVVSMFIVFITVTGYFMSKQREAKLKATITSLVSEREQILAGLPESIQVLIIKRYSKRGAKILHATPTLQN